MGNLVNALKPMISDLASTIFFAALLAVTGNVYWSTGIGIAVGIAQVAIQKLRRREIPLMQWMSLALVIVFGTLTLYFHDPRFVMVKFTIGHLAVAAAMLQRNWLSRYLPPIVTGTLSERELAFYSALWPTMMVGLAIANLYIGFTMGQVAWQWFLGVGSPAAPWVLFAIQYATIRLRVGSILRRQRVVAAAPAE